MDEKSLSLLSFVMVTMIALGFTHKKKRVIKVSEIYIYPIKSCAGIKVTEAKITRRGFEHDRMLMIVDNNGKFISQRSYPQLALVQTSITYSSSSSSSSDENGNSHNSYGPDRLTLHAEHMDDLVIPLSSKINGPLLDVTVWGDTCKAYEIIDGSFWFREYLDKEGLKLVRMDTNHIRFTDPNYSPDGETSFSDGYPFLLTTQESLSDTNTRLTKKITMERFRPNIVVNGCLPYEEDKWKSLLFKSKKTIEMKAVKLCSRCTIPNVDPITGISDPNRQPIKTMESFRSGESIGLEKESWQKKIFFGINLDHEAKEGGIIEVGDIVEVSR